MKSFLIQIAGLKWRIFAYTAEDALAIAFRKRWPRTRSNLNLTVKINGKEIA